MKNYNRIFKSDRKSAKVKEVMAKLELNTLMMLLFLFLFFYFHLQLLVSIGLLITFYLENHTCMFCTS